MPTLYSMVNEAGNRNRILERCKIRFLLVHWIDPRSTEHMLVVYPRHWIDPLTSITVFCRTRVYPMHWSKPEFAHHWNPISISGFIHHCIQSRHCWISSVRGIWYWPVEKCGDQSRKAAKIRFCTAHKFANYLRFVSQKKQASMLAHVWAACKIWWKSVKNCGRNT